MLAQNSSESTQEEQLTRKIFQKISKLVLVFQLFVAFKILFTNTVSLSFDQKENF